jgi:hypothetical protein
MEQDDRNGVALQAEVSFFLSSAPFDSHAAQFGAHFVGVGNQ